MIKKLLIANRGEIALRIVRACKQLGIQTVGVYSTADDNLMHLRFVDESICIGKPNASQSYLNIDTILTAAEISGADAIHPGYGFLSENAEFAERVEEAGLTFVGPAPEHIRLMGNKISAINAMKKAGVPTVPGSVGSVTLANAEEQARAIGFPLLIKAAAGGGGRGMRVVERLEQLLSQVQAAKQEAELWFGDDSVYMERFLKNPRHVEVQVLGEAKAMPFIYLIVIARYNVVTKKCLKKPLPQRFLMISKNPFCKLASVLVSKLTIAVQVRLNFYMKMSNFSLLR